MGPGEAGSEGEEGVWEAGVCVAQRADGAWLPAEVLQRREVRGARQLYVHYVGQDRRLDEWLPAARVLPAAPAPVPAPASPPRAAVTRRTRRRDEPAELHREPDAAELEHERRTRVKRVARVQLGRYEIDAWYYSPYPRPRAKLWLCQYCLSYARRPAALRRHAASCQCRTPPGREIYRAGTLAVWEVDARSHKLYCQNLCLLAKLFLDHKTLYFDIEQFLFYVLCEVDREGAQLVGYFSKEKCSIEGNNVACILTLPPHQRRGYGRLLIALSYELSRRERVPGGPEKPLSDLGRLSYRSYWAGVLLRELAAPRPPALRELSHNTGVAQADVLATLQAMNMLKYWRGHHVVCVTPKAVAEQLAGPHFRKPRYPLLPENLRWAPRPRPVLRPGKAHQPHHV